MSFLNNIAKVSYPYKIIQSGYALSSSHKIFKSCTTLVLAKQLFHTLVFSNFFNLHAIHEPEPWTQHYRWNRIWWLWRRQKRRKIVSHQLGISTGYGDGHQQISMRVSKDFHATDALELECTTKENQWVCIQLACS